MASLVIEARYKTYRDAKEWELAKIMADLLTKRFPDQVEWLINKSEAMREMGDPPGAITNPQGCSRNEFAENAEYCFAVGYGCALLGEFMEARSSSGKRSELDSKFGVEFLEDSAFDGVWGGFREHSWTKLV